jgi:GNAT superfamily N-acetyltransferase
MEGILIREFKKTDRGMVESFFAQMSPETNQRFNPEDCNHIGAIKFFDNPQNGRIDFMADDQGIMAGYTFLWDIDRSIIWLGAAVHEAYMGRGLGTCLIQHDIAWAREHGKGGILLETNQDNFRAQGLYEKTGFKRLGISNASQFLYLYRF